MTIDGVQVQVPAGTTVLEAARLANIQIPTLCYLKDVNQIGACRMCLVEQGMPPRLAPGQTPSYDEQGFQPIQWMPRPIISCANTVAENMGVRTDSPLAAEARRGVLEFLLTSHPLDCPICDQAGECKLQEYSIDYGQIEGRYEEKKTKKGKNLSIGPRVNLDQERCVLCGRCVRFMRDIMHDEVLTMSQRGTYNAITVYPGRELDSNYSLNTVDLCPVGALTSKDFRFKMRVWFLKETKTIDVDCGTGTNITLWTREDRVYRITPRPNDAVNSCWMPDSHRLNYKYINSPQRIPQPVIRTDAGAPHRPATWEPALASAAEAFKRISPDKIAIIASGRMTNEELYMVRHLAAQIGTDKMDIVPRTGESDGMLISADRNPNTNGAKLVLGIEPGSRLDAIREGVRNGSVKAVLALGEDLTAPEAGFTPEDLKKLDYLFMIAHSANETGRHADLVLPGVTYAEKFGTMINVAGRIQRLNRAIRPVGYSRDDWQILRDITVALGGNPALKDFSSALDILTVMSTEYEELNGLTWGSIGDGGRPILETGVTIPVVERERNQSR